MKVITVYNTLPYGHASTYQLSLTYLERQKQLWSGQVSLKRSRRRSESGRKNQTIKQYVSLRSKGRHNKISWIKENVKTLGAHHSYNVDKDKIWKDIILIE
jgi:hypothetical protein